MVLADWQIKELAAIGMIEPFEPSLIRKIEDKGILSYGLSSYGYDIRLSPADFKVFRHIPGTIINPKNFNTDNLFDAPLQSDEWGDYFILPGYSYGLGVALERIRMPSNVTAVCVGKSTYARVGCIANVTPFEASWEGHATLEFSNSSPADMRIYANEGVIQVLFFEGQECRVSYASRRGKYQFQPESVVTAKV